ncbi:hypothetical protein AVEN_52496-1 [Araneus ventricosus]|uniref:Uncharacterized protein n=1 Tax=Araneus ventricosus TaxID=182803 RepID=A0A4Y2MTY5_ARAVE|nr:hypothetical protein AVEN_52496-1 [Araneus ventricosus]
MIPLELFAKDVGIPIMKTEFNVDCGGSRIAVLPRYLYAPVFRPDPVRTLGHPTCLLLSSGFRNHFLLGYVPQHRTLKLQDTRQDREQHHETRMTERHHGKKMAAVAPPTIERRRQLIVTATTSICFHGSGGSSAQKQAVLQKFSLELDF